VVIFRAADQAVSASQNLHEMNLLFAIAFCHTYTVLTEEWHVIWEACQDPETE
jgi:hypothetical protein